MGFAFATCERHRALGFLKKMYPSAEVTDTEESAGPLLEHVEKDVIRVGDPEFHGGAIFPSKGSSDEISAAMAEAQKFHDRTMDSIMKAREVQS